MPRITIDPDTLPTDAPVAHYGAGYITNPLVQDTALSMLNEHAEALDTLESGGSYPSITDDPDLGVIIDNVNGVGIPTYLNVNEGTTLYSISGGSPLRVKGTGAQLIIDTDHASVGLGFYGAAPIPLQTGVAVTAAAIHAALVNLGLIAA